MSKISDFFLPFNGTLGLCDTATLSPAGPVLPGDWRYRRRADTPGCDPRRPRRAGAAATRRPSQTRARHCDPRRPRRAGAAPTSGQYRVVIQGCCDPRRPRRAGAALVASSKVFRMPLALRSSPTPEGRCCRIVYDDRVWRITRCDPRRPRRAGAARCQRGCG